MREGVLNLARVNLARVSDAVAIGEEKLTPRRNFFSSRSVFLRKRFWFERGDIVIIAPDDPFLEPPTLRSLDQGVLVNRGFHNCRRDTSRVEEKQVDRTFRALRGRRDNEVGVKVTQAAATAHGQERVFALERVSHFAASARPSSAGELAVENERGSETLAFTLVER